MLRQKVMATIVVLSCTFSLNNDLSAADYFRDNSEITNQLVEKPIGPSDRSCRPPSPPIPGPTGPTGPFGFTGPTGPAGSGGVTTPNSFSAVLTAFSFPLNNVFDFTGYAPAILPFYNNTTFDPTTGVFTVPIAGRYSIKALINYNVVEAVPGPLGAGANTPFFGIRVNGGVAQIGNLPVVNVAAIRTILDYGQIVMEGDLELSVGDTLQISYFPQGNPSSINIEASFLRGLIWSVHQID